MDEILEEINVSGTAPTVIEIELEDDEERNQLGSSRYENTAAQESAPRETVAWRKVLNYKYIMTCQPPRLGFFENTPVCSVTIDLIFRTILSSARYQQAHLFIEVVDGSAAHLSMDEPFAAPAIINKPKVLAWSPKLYHGVTITDTGKNSHKATAGASDPANIMTASFEASRERPVPLEGYEKIQSSKIESDNGTTMEWDIHENSFTRRGIYSNFSVVMLVAYTKGRKFALRPRLVVDLGLPFWHPICGEKDAPLMFDAGSFVGSTQIFTAEELKNGTRLDAFGGTFVHGY